MTSHEWKPGDMVVATVRGVQNVRMVRERYKSSLSESGVRDGWWIPAPPNLDFRPGVRDDEITDARPLVVIDPENEAQVTRLANALVDSHADHRYGVHQDWLSVQAALREFADPKLEEPTGLGAAVELVKPEAHEWARAVHVGGGLWMFFDSSGSGGRVRWENLNVVRVISGGEVEEL